MQQLIQGNEACALGAVNAGCSFFAGYPIPSSEIMEWMARLLPARGGVFVQMEDELASMGAVIGASWTGAKAMTATSGPGFSLMQEHIGYAAMTETPCVIIDSQRVGPSTGMPTMPGQGDVVQARWGSHGDRPAIALTASSVCDTYEMTVEAFNLSEPTGCPFCSCSMRPSRTCERTWSFPSSGSAPAPIRRLLKASTRSAPRSSCPLARAQGSCHRPGT